MNELAKIQTRRRWAAVVVFLLIYVGSYYHLSPRGLAETEAAMGVEGVFYARIDGGITTADLVQHQLLAWVFAPLNWLDHQLFDTPEPPLCIPTELS
jgi:hypothetical protein